MSKYQAVTGMNDLLPATTPAWQCLEKAIAQVLNQYCYREIRFPILENTALFKRSIGEVTDIVEKEMYTFTDIGGDSLSLRPEGTASCVRAGVQHGLLFNQIQRLWYIGPMFRHERPQKGRFRQFHQVGVEAFGMAGPDIDIELIAITARLWEQLGLSDKVVLEINSLGSLDNRNAFKKDLVSYLTSHQDSLDEDSQRRLSTNPLRILDSKDASTQALLKNAPKLADYWDTGTIELYQGWKQGLDAMGITYKENPTLVRGLDYYNDTVFEWTTTQLGAQGTVCAGGRYDKLVEQIGGKPTPGIGFAMGLERLLLLLGDAFVEASSSTPFAYVTAVGEVTHFAHSIAEKLRNLLPEAKVLSHCGGGSFKNQMKKADKSMAQVALLIGEDEASKGQITIKYLRGQAEQVTLDVNAAITLLSQLWQTSTRGE